MNLQLNTNVLLYTLPIEYRPIIRHVVVFGNPGLIPNIRVLIEADGRIVAARYNESVYTNALISGSYIRAAYID